MNEDNNKKIHLKGTLGFARKLSKNVQDTPKESSWTGVDSMEIVVVRDVKMDFFIIILVHVCSNLTFYRGIKVFLLYFF